MGSLLGAGGDDVLVLTITRSGYIEKRVIITVYDNWRNRRFMGACSVSRIFTKSVIIGYSNFLGRHLGFLPIILIVLMILKKKHLELLHLHFVVYI